MLAESSSEERPGVAVMRQMHAYAIEKNLNVKHAFQARTTHALASSASARRLRAIRLLTGCVVPGRLRWSIGPDWVYIPAEVQNDGTCVRHCAQTLRPLGSHDAASHDRWA